MYIISKKCISIVVLICFIINVTSSSKAYGLSISAPIIEDNLATASIFDDLKGAQHKDIANISLALQAYLLKYGTNLIDINSLKEAILFEDTVYSPAEMHFIFSGEGMKDINDKYASVKCKLKKGDRVEDYYVIFSKEKSNNGFHLEVLTEKEWQKYERAQLDTLPTRDSQKSKNAFGRDTGMVDTEIYPETEELEEELLCHMPGLIKRKHGHVQYVNKFAHKFYEKRFDELYETFRDKAVSEEDLPSKIEYMAVLEQLYAIYQGLSDEGKELLKVLTIFHDIGAIKEGRDWEHSILGSKFAIPILRQFNYSDAFIKKVVRLIGKHGFFSDMGVAFLPIDFSELSKEEKNILLLFSLFDGSARGDGSNRMKPWKIRLLKSFKNGLITRLRNSEKLYMYRLTNLLAPVTFAGEEGRKTQKRKIKKILARKGYATKSFMNNWNNLIRVYAFNMFTLNGEDSLEDFVDLTKAVSDTIDEYEKNHPEDDIKEVIVDTDIDFMGLPFPSQKYYATKFNELFKSGKKLPVTVSFSDGTLKIIMEVGKSFPTVSSLHITSLDPDSFAWNDENVVMNKILSIAEKDSRTGRKGLFIAGALVRDDGENLIASEVSVPEITGIYGHVGDHVEMIILKEAQRRGWDLSRCTLYVTLENCYNCAKAISNNFRPKKVIIGCEDDSQKGPNDLSVDGRGFTFLNAGGIPTKIIKNDALYERALNLMEKQDLWAQINRTEYEKARKDPEGTLKVIYNSNYLKDKEDYDDFLDWTVYWLVKNSDQFDSNEWQQVYAIDADKFVDEPGSILTEEAIQLILWGVLRINSSNDKYKLVLTGGAENCQKVADAVIKYTSERGRVEYEMITPERVFILPVSRGKSIKAGDIKPYEEKSSHTFQISKRIKDLIAGKFKGKVLYFSSTGQEYHSPRDMRTSLDLMTLISQKMGLTQKEIEWVNDATVLHELLDRTDSARRKSLEGSAETRYDWDTIDLSDIDEFCRDNNLEDYVTYKMKLFAKYRNVYKAFVKDLEDPEKIDRNRLTDKDVEDLKLYIHIAVTSDNFGTACDASKKRLLGRKSESFLDSFYKWDLERYLPSKTNKKAKLSVSHLAPFKALISLVAERNEKIMSLARKFRTVTIEKFLAKGLIPELGKISEEDYTFIETANKDHFLVSYFLRETPEDLTFIKDVRIIEKLEKMLDFPDAEVKEDAARLIVDEVLDTEFEGQYTNLRLKALEILEQMIDRKATYPDGRADLHLHNYLSDAYQSPSSLVLAAYEKGLTHIAVTNHNLITDKETFLAADIMGVTVIPGVEIDTDVTSVPGFEASVKHKENAGIHVQLFFDKDEFLSKQEEILNDPFVLGIKKLAQYYHDRTFLMAEIINSGEMPGLEDCELSDEDILRYSRGAITPLDLGVALFYKYREKFESLGITQPKEINGKYLQKYEADDEWERLRPTIDEVLNFAKKFNAKVGLPHPTPKEYTLDVTEKNLSDPRRKEITKKRFSSIIKYISRFVFNGDSINLLWGIELFSHKLRGVDKEHLWQAEIKKTIDNLNSTDPVFKNNPLITYVGSDAHGKWSEAKEPLGLPEEAYPDSAAFAVDSIKKSTRDTGMIDPTGDTAGSSTGKTKELDIVIQMKALAKETGTELSRPILDKNYTLITCGDFYKDKKEYRQDILYYKSIFNIERIKPSHPKTLITKILATIKEKGLDPSNVMVQLPKVFADRKEDLERLVASVPGVKFMIIDTQGMKEDKDRFSYRRNIYSMMLLARHIDQDSLEGSKAHMLLKFLIGSCMGEATDEMISAYINALVHNDISSLIGKFLSYRPMKKYNAREEYHNISKALIAA